MWCVWGVSAKKGLWLQEKENVCQDRVSGWALQRTNWWMSDRMNNWCRDESSKSVKKKKNANHYRYHCKRILKLRSSLAYPPLDFKRERNWQRKWEREKDRVIGWSILNFRSSGREARSVPEGTQLSSFLPFGETGFVAGDALLLWLLLQLVVIGCSLDWLS